MHVAKHTKYGKAVIHAVNLSVQWTITRTYMEYANDYTFPDMGKQ